MGNNTLNSHFNTTFNPFPGGFDQADARCFKKDFAGLEEVLQYDGQKLFQHMKKCIDMPAIAQKHSFVHRAQNETDQGVAQIYSDLADKLDGEIRDNYKTDVSNKFNAYLTNRLNPQGKLSKREVQTLKDRITALFSGKAFTALFTHVINAEAKKKHNILLFQLPDDYFRSCELIIPKDSKSPIQIVAKINSTFSNVMDLKTMKDTIHPVPFEAKAIYTIARNGKVTAKGHLALPDQINLPR